MPKPAPEAAGAVVYRTPAGDPLTQREQKQKLALVRYAQSRAAEITALHTRMATNAEETGIQDVLARLEPYLGSGYGLPKAQKAYEKLLEARGDAPVEQKLETLLAFHDAIDNLAASYFAETTRYANDYFKRWELTKHVFNYQYPDSVFHDELAGTLKAFLSSYRDKVEKLDPRLQMSGTFGPGWRPLGYY